MHNENFKVDFLQMASATQATFKSTSRPNLLEYKCDLSIKITSRTCKFDTCRYLKLPNFKLKLISCERVTLFLLHLKGVSRLTHWERHLQAENI